MTESIALIIEDDTRLGNILEIVLHQAGFITQVINDGAEALAYLATGTPGIILLDLHLPSVSGVEILRHIRADNRLASVPIIVVTADLNLAQSIKAQVDHVLFKPMSVASLRTIAAKLHPDTPDTPDTVTPTS
ncbi:MAG: response regulator [Candidatus Promineifilaceae bacterium]